MLVVTRRGKSMDVSLNPQFLTDLGMLVQIVFPKPTQSFLTENEIICVLESNRKLMSIRNPVEGMFQAFNVPCEQLPEKYTADQVLFSVQPMTIDEYQKEKAGKVAKMVKKNLSSPVDIFINDEREIARMRELDMRLVMAGQENQIDEQRQRARQVRLADLVNPIRDLPNFIVNGQEIRGD